MEAMKPGVRAVSESAVYVVAIITISLLALSAIVGLVFLRPLSDNSLPILIIGFVVPTLAALLSALRAQDAVRQAATTGQQIAELHVLVNSRLTQLLALTAASSRAEGVLAAQGGAAAPAAAEGHG